MNNRRLQRGLTLSAAALAVTAFGLPMAAAQERQPRPEQPQARPGQTGQAGQMDLSQELERLRPLAGMWNVTMTVTGDVTPIMRDRGEGAEITPQEGTVVHGIAIRDWVLDNKLLSEQLQVTRVERQGAGGAQPGDQPGQQQPGQRQRGQQQRGQQPGGDMTAQMTDELRNYSGLGLIGYDEKVGMYSHLWAESVDGTMVLSFGEWDASANALVYPHHFGGYTSSEQLLSAAQGQGRGQGQGQQPGQAGGQDQQQQLTQRVQQTLEQGLSRAGVEEGEARQQARTLARQIIQQEPEEEQLQRQIQQALQEAGAEEQQIEQHAQRLAQQINQQLEQAGDAVRVAQRPGQRGQAGQFDPVVRVNIINENQHEVLVRQSQERGNDLLFRIVYTRAGQPGQEGQPGQQPRRPGTQPGQPGQPGGTGGGTPR